MDNPTLDNNNLNAENQNENSQPEKQNDETFESVDRYINGANKFIISERLRKKIIFIAKMGGLKGNDNFFDPDLDWKTIHNYDDPFTQLFLDHSVDTISPEVVRTNYEYLTLFWKNIKAKAEAAEDKTELNTTYGHYFWNEALNILDNVFDKLNSDEKINTEREKLSNRESAKLNFVLINKIDKRLAENLLTPSDVKVIFAEGEKLKITEDQTVEILWYHLVKLGWEPINGEKDESNKKECLLNLYWGPLSVMDLKNYISGKLQNLKSSNGHFKKIIIEAETLGIGEEQAIFILWDHLLDKGWAPSEGNIDEDKKKESLFNCEWIPGSLKSIRNRIDSNMKEGQLSKEQIEALLQDALKQNISEAETLDTLWNAFEEAGWQPVEGERDAENKKSNLLSNDWAPVKEEIIKPIERSYVRSSAAQSKSPLVVTTIVGVLAAIIFSVFGLPALLENKDAAAEEMTEGKSEAMIAGINSKVQPNNNKTDALADDIADKNSEADKINEPKETPSAGEVKKEVEVEQPDSESKNKNDLALENNVTKIEEEAAAELAAIELMYNEISAEFENYIKKGKVENAAGTLKRLDSFVKENSLSHSTKKYKRVLNKISKMVFIPGKNIYMDKFEITVKDYKDYSKTKAGVKFPFLPEWNKDDFQPMINVSFDDAQKFAGYNGKRLPTLDEWKAAAGLTKSNNNFFSDDESPRRYANVYDLVSSSKDTYTKTAPVGKFAPNKNNLYDLVGNVEEWCIGSDSTPTRVGGHYGTKESRSRSFRSKTHNPDYTSERVGFRCVVDVDTLLK